MNISSLLGHISFSCSLTFLFLVGGFWNVIDHNEMVTLSLFSISYLLGTGLGHRVFRYFEKERQFSLPFAYLGGALLGSGILILRYTIYYFELRAISPLLLIFISSFFSAASGWLNALLRPPKQPLDRPAYLISFLISTSLPYFFLTLSLSVGFQTAAFAGCVFFLSSTALLAALQQKSHLFKEVLIHLIPVVIILPILWFLQKDLASMSTKNSSLRVVREVFGAHKKYVLAEEDAVGPLKVGPPQHLFYVDGVVRFSSEWEQMENQCLVTFPIQVLQRLGFLPEKILVIGGGDGLAARNALQSPSVKSVKVLESDSSFLQVARDELKMRIYNLDSLKNPRTEIIAKDIFWWISTQETQKFDLIILDLPVPTEVNTMRLFSAEFLKRLLDLATDEGAIVMKAGPLYLQQRKGVFSPTVLEVRSTWASLQQDPLIYSTQTESTAFALVFKNRAKESAQSGISPKQLYGASQCRTVSISGQDESSTYTLNTLHLKSQFINNVFSRGFSGERFVFLPN